MVGLRDQVLQRALGQLLVDGLRGELGPSDDSDQSPLQLAHRLIELRRDELDHVVRDRQTLTLRLELQDRDPRLEVWRLHVDAEAPAEPAHEALLETGQLVRRSVGGDRDLPPASVEMVERVEEFCLRLLALGEELDVVDQQDVHLAVPVAELVPLTFAHGLDELGDEALGRHVLHADPRVDAVHVMAHGDQQVRLAQTHTAIDE